MQYINKVHPTTVNSLGPGSCISCRHSGHRSASSFKSTWRQGCAWLLTVSQCVTWRLCRRLEIGEAHCSPNSPTDPTNVYQGMPDMPLPAQSYSIYSIYSTFRPRLGPHLPIHNDHIHHGRDTNQLTCTVHEIFARGQEIDQVVEPHALPTAPGFTVAKGSYRLIKLVG